MIQTQDELDQLVDRLVTESVIAVDCEMDSMYAYSTSLCVVQFGWPEGEALMDGLADLDRSVLARLFADPSIVKVFHGGENDIGLLRDRWSLEFSNVFDTMAASQVLGHDGYGLAAVMERHFDVHLSKKFQKADWRVRPLPDDQAEYARLDVRYLISLRERLQEELVELERVEEAESEFLRISRASIPQKLFDPDAWAKVKGARDLPLSLSGMVRALNIARDELSRRFDRAPYRVMHDSAIIALARAAPKDEAAYRRVRGVNRRLGHEDVARLLSAVVEGRAAGEIPMPARPSRRKPWESGEGKLTPAQEKVFEALRSWRMKRAKQRGVEVARIGTTALLASIAQAMPDDLEALGKLDGVEPWRLREYGEAIMSVVKRVAP
jgi:ribonuclease D